MGSDPAKNSGFLRAIKIHSMTSFIGEVKALAVAVRFYSMLKIPAEYDRYFAGRIYGHFTPSFSLLQY
jgi:hypothetical protein